MTVISIDIGTTAICALAMDAEDGQVLESLSVKTPCMENNDPLVHLQDPELIVQLAKEMFIKLKDKYGPVCCAGITGQMHGILYADSRGQAVSPLFTWQDNRGSLVYKNNITYTEYLAGLTRTPVASGYGLVTHFILMHSGQVPETAAKLCTIGDYLVMRLTGRQEPLLHITNAASLGFFNIDSGFDHNALDKAEIGNSILPVYSANIMAAGTTPDGILVSIATGDNQAAFLGSVSGWEDTILVNIGTGSQVSFIDDNIYKNLETRPFYMDRHLQTGAGLCGGRAYALLENFFSEVLKMADLKPEQPLYQAMEKCLAENEKQNVPCRSTDASLSITNDPLRIVNDPLRIVTKFSGTRQNPNERGSIENISFNNLTPENFIQGFISGIVNELWELLPCPLQGKTVLVASGNAIRKNSFMVKTLSNKFNLPVKIPLYPEEAACGAAYSALTASGRFSSLTDAKKFIRYKKAEDSREPIRI